MSQGHRAGSTGFKSSSGGEGRVPPQGLPPLACIASPFSCPGDTR